MYRQYEDPYVLEKMLEEAEAKLEQAKQEMWDDDSIIGCIETVEELKERVNFAWQDEEYDENYARDYYADPWFDDICRDDN